MKKRSIPLLAVLFVLGITSLSFAQAFPTKDLSGVIQSGAGGATDNVARAVTPLVEKHLGKQEIRPVRLINRVMAILAASIWRELSQPHSTA